MKNRIENLKRSGVRAAFSSEILTIIHKTKSILDKFSEEELSKSVLMNLNIDRIRSIITDMNYIILLIEEYNSINFEEKK